MPKKVMNPLEIESSYNKFYKHIDFERKGLFRTIKNINNPKSVIYFGSSIHITPSFIFQNVTYVDKSELSKKFFNNLIAVKTFISNNREYKQDPFIKFYHIDFLSDYFEVNHKFDLAISLFSMSSIRIVSDYVKKGGMIIFLPLSNPQSNNDIDSLKYYGYIAFSKKYEFHKSEIRIQNNPAKKFIKNDLFIEKNIYDIYIKQ